LEGGNKTVGISWDPFDKYVACLRFDNSVIIINNYRLSFTEFMIGELKQLLILVVNKRILPNIQVKERIGKWIGVKIAVICWSPI